MKELLKGFAIGLLAGLLILGGIFLYMTWQDRQSPQTDSKEVTAEPTEPAFPEEDLSPEPEILPSDEEPQETASVPEETPAPREATLAFAGDVMFSEQFLASYDRSGIQAIAGDAMRSHMEEADLFMVNEEFPFSLRGEPMDDKQYTFRTDPKYVKIFQELGVDVVTVANNHALDFGKDAFCDTLETLQQSDIACAGGGYSISEASAPVIRTVGGQSFAIFAATRVSPSYDWYATDSQPGIFQTYDPAKLNAAIAEAEPLYDHVIVFVHWGIERNETPEEYQRVLAKGYIDAGADLVVGCHPHVLQGFEYYKDVPIVYSLGNYLFGNRSGQTVLLSASFSPEGTLALKLIPCQRANGVLSQISEPSELFRHLTELSFGVAVGADGSITAE